jgi:hypothetical protein
MHSLAGGPPRRHRYPSRNAAELEPHQAVTAAPLLGIGHPNFDADLLYSTTTSLSLPLLSSLCFSPSQDPKYGSHRFAPSLVGKQTTYLLP